MQIKEIRVGSRIEEGGQEVVAVTYVVTTGNYRITGQGTGDDYDTANVAALENVLERMPPERSIAADEITQLLEVAKTRI